MSPSSAHVVRLTENRSLLHLWCKTVKYANVDVVSVVVA